MKLDFNIYKDLLFAYAKQNKDNKSIEYKLDENQLKNLYVNVERKKITTENPYQPKKIKKSNENEVDVSDLLENKNVVDPLNFRNLNGNLLHKCIINMFFKLNTENLEDYLNLMISLKFNDYVMLNTETNKIILNDLKFETEIKKRIKNEATNKIKSILKQMTGKKKISNDECESHLDFEGFEKLDELINEKYKHNKSDIKIYFLDIPETEVDFIRFSEKELIDDIKEYLKDNILKQINNTVTHSIKIINSNYNTKIYNKKTRNLSYGITSNNITEKNNIITFTEGNASENTAINIFYMNFYYNSESRNIIDIYNADTKSKEIIDSLLEKLIGLKNAEDVKKRLVLKYKEEQKLEIKNLGNQIIIDKDKNDYLTISPIVSIEMLDLINKLTVEKPFFIKKENYSVGGSHPKNINSFVKDKNGKLNVLKASFPQIKKNTKLQKTINKIIYSNSLINTNYYLLRREDIKKQIKNINKEIDVYNKKYQYVTGNKNISFYYNKTKHLIDLVFCDFINPIYVDILSVEETLKASKYEKTKKKMEIFYSQNDENLKERDIDDLTDAISGMVRLNTVEFDYIFNGFNKKNLEFRNHLEKKLEEFIDSKEFNITVLKEDINIKEEFKKHTKDEKYKEWGIYE